MTAAARRLEDDWVTATRGARPRPPGTAPGTESLVQRVLLRRRAALRESLDGSVPHRELRENLADFARLNRLPGGTLASARAVQQLVPVEVEAPSVLDVGTGGADMLRAFGRLGWRATGCDSHPEVIRAVAGADSQIDIVAADARALPFDDGAFDVAHSSLLLHHLDLEGAVAALAEMRRVSRFGVVVNDLRRGVMPFVATGVSLALFARARITRVDGLISVRRAYTTSELDDLLSLAGLTPTWRSATWMPRVVTAATARAA